MCARDMNILRPIIYVKFRVDSESVRNENRKSNMVEIIEIRHGLVMIYCHDYYIYTQMNCFYIIPRCILSPRSIFWIHISTVTMFYIYIFTHIYFQNQKVIIIINDHILIIIYMMQMSAYGCEWMRMDALVYNNDKTM